MSSTSITYWIHTEFFQSSTDQIYKSSKSISSETLNQEIKSRSKKPGINAGFIPAVGTTQSLVRLIGRPRALNYQYNGTLLFAAEALEITLGVLCAPERLPTEVQTYAVSLAKNPAEALAAIRRTIIDFPGDESVTYLKSRKPGKNAINISNSTKT